jgi:hypothetical protein
LSIAFIESIGPLKIGMPANDVKKVIKQKPEFDSHRTERQSDLKFEQEWIYSQLGITIGMGSEDKDSEQSVESIVIVSPCTFSTKKRIKIGSNENEVISAYKKNINKLESIPGESISIGDGHEGLFFKIVNGKVSEIIICIAVD